MKDLFQGELKLTLDIILGLLVGEIFIRSGIADLILKKFSRLKIPSVTALAVAVSAGSSKTGAAVIASAFEKNQISEAQAIWSVLMLSFPSYLKRWPGTLVLSVSMAGSAGFFFALSLIFRSAMRFVWAYKKLRSIIPSSHESQNFFTNTSSLKEKEKSLSKNGLKFFSKLIKTLPYAWIFFALAYSLVPVINNFFENNIKFFSFLPLAGWAVAAGSVAHVSAALALAGGALASGELNTVQATFALILGSGFGTATRILRQNAGYYFGLFPAKTAQKMLALNFFTIMSLIFLNLFFASLAFLL